ncbi:hypothetical protein BGZ81_003441 [Podila clonocystis]|nr:hypothetical protein BGZ81_003441 [Podila clonocystis]
MDGNDALNDIDDYDAIMMEENEDFISPSPSGEDFFDEKSGGQRLAPQRIVDKNFFNDFPDLFDEDL